MRGLTTAAGVWLTAAVGAACEDGRGILRRILSTCTARDFKVADIEVDRAEGGEANSGAVTVILELHGRSPLAALAGKLGEIDGVLTVAAGDVNEMFD